MMKNRLTLALAGRRRRCCSSWLAPSAVGAGAAASRER